MKRFPVITIDGPSASGKGTVAERVARALHFRYLDSGALYRTVALAAKRTGLTVDYPEMLVELTRHLDIHFKGTEVFLAGRPVGHGIRSEEVGRAASKIAAIPAVREALLERQRAFRGFPGLVTDGRDMGSTVFPDAAVKVYLTASAEERAQRRYKQLMEKGLDANLAALLKDLQERDARDAARSVAPLQQMPDARLLDTTEMTIDDAVDQVLRWYHEVRTA